MANVALTVSGNRYEMKLEDDFAAFVNKDLQEAGVNVYRDNTPDKLLKAYLRLAKRLYDHEGELEALIQLMEEEEGSS